MTQHIGQREITRPEQGACNAPGRICFEAAPIKFILNFYCDVSFRVRPNKRIVGWRYVGNNCNWNS